MWLGKRIQLEMSHVQRHAEAREQSNFPAQLPAHVI